MNFGRAGPSRTGRRDPILKECLAVRGGQRGIPGPKSRYSSLARPAGRCRRPVGRPLTVPWPARCANGRCDVYGEAPAMLIRRPHRGPVLVAIPGQQSPLPDVRSADQAREQFQPGADTGDGHGEGRAHGDDDGADAPRLHSGGWNHHATGRECSPRSSSPGASRSEAPMPRNATEAAPRPTGSGNSGRSWLKAASSLMNRRRWWS